MSDFGRAVDRLVAAIRATNARNEEVEWFRRHVLADRAGANAGLEACVLTPEGEQISEWGPTDAPLKITKAGTAAFFGVRLRANHDAVIVVEGSGAIPVTNGETVEAYGLAQAIWKDRNKGL